MAYGGNMLSNNAFEWIVRRLGREGYMRRCVASLGIATFVTTFAHAEIEKLATPGPAGISFSWWPKVVVPAAWQHERDQS
jgi:hypothetical protein